MKLTSAHPSVPVVGIGASCASTEAVSSAGVALPSLKNAGTRAL
jgi:hypothetical protein